MPAFAFSKSGEVRLVWPSPLPGELRPLTRASLEVALQAQVSEDGVVAPQREWRVILGATIFADLIEEALTGKRGVLAAHVIEKLSARHPAAAAVAERSEVLRYLVVPGLLTEVLWRARAIIAGNPPAHNSESR